MRVQKGHYHAYTEYDLVSWKHYAKLLVSVVECKLRRGWSLTVHLPFEVQHSEYCGSLGNGLRFINFGERLKKIFGVKLYWENAPWLNYKVWDLKYDNTNWTYVSNMLELTLDTGHLILGSKDNKEARERIYKIIKQIGWQIKHLHLHENDFIHDYHDIKSRRVLGKLTVKKITKGRSYIWERGNEKSKCE